MLRIAGSGSRSQSLIITAVNQVCVVLIAPIAHRTGRPIVSGLLDGFKAMLYWAS